jgi:hypothetical protein
MRVRVTGGPSSALRGNPFRPERAICAALLPLLICGTAGCEDAAMNVGTNDGIHQQQNGDGPKSQTNDAGYPSPPAPGLAAALAPDADASALHPAQAGNMDEPSAAEGDASSEGAGLTSDGALNTVNPKPS